MAGGHSEALLVVAEVMELEAAGRKERRVERLRRASKLPPGKTFATLVHVGANHSETISANMSEPIGKPPMGLLRDGSRRLKRGADYANPARRARPSAALNAAARSALPASASSSSASICIRC